MAANNKGTEKSVPINFNYNEDNMSYAQTAYGRVYMDSDGNLYPSASTIPSYGIPKPPYLIKWLVERSNGDYDKFLNLQSWESRLGSAVHNLCEQWLLGNKIDLTSNDVNDYCDTTGVIAPLDGVIQIRKAVQAFIAFWELNQPELISTEQLVWGQSKDDDGNIIYPFAGRIDIVARIDGKIWILDIKTSKTVADVINYQVQLGIYKLLYEDMTGEEVHGIGIIWAKKDFLNAAPPKSVLSIIKYKFDEELIWDTYKMFQRVYKGLNPRHHIAAQSAAQVYERNV